MKIVVDTNVLVSGLYRLGFPPGRLLLWATEDRISLYAPVSVQVELHRALKKKLSMNEDEVQSVMEVLPVNFIEEDEYREHVLAAQAAIRDPHDAPVVALALLMGAAIVSGDRAFHPLRKPVVPTVAPRELVERIAAGVEPGSAP